MRNKPAAQRSIGIDADQATLDKYHQDSAGVELVCNDALSVLESFDFDQVGRTLIYDDLLHDWRTLEFQVMTRGGVRTEKLWMNYELDASHWASFAGSNFTDRQRIKRKATRWANNYRQQPPGERLAILAVEGMDIDRSDCRALPGNTPGHPATSKPFPVDPRPRC